MRAIARWLNRQVLSKIGLRVVRTRQPLYSRTYGAKLLYFRRLLELTENVPGVIVECGVAGGGTLVLFATLNANGNNPRNIWGFDTFTGLPTPSDEDFDLSGGVASEGMFKADEETVMEVLRIAGFDEQSMRDQITLVKGPVSETLPIFEEQIALLHCDLDLYEGTKATLENLWPRVGVGGIAAFDEYGHREWPGERQAIDEYFASAIEDGSVELVHDPYAFRTYAIKHK